MKALVEKNKHNMCLAKASAKSSCAYKKMSVAAVLLKSRFKLAYTQ